MFQSTHSLRSATWLMRALVAELEVSIHALLAECDWGHTHRQAAAYRFNPRTPCGVRLKPVIDLLFGDWFQSTHSLRSATRGIAGSSKNRSVSIHALLAECDAADLPPTLRRYCFNPRTPCGVRPFLTGFHASLLSSFNPRTPCGVRLRPTLYIATQQSKSYFAPTSLK